MARSAVQAARARRVIRPTPPTVVARYANPAPETAYSLEYAYHLLGDLTGRRVLDLGCGEGDNCSLIARRGARVFAVDISLDLLRIARQRAIANGLDHLIECRCGSAHAIPAADTSVDVVFGNAVLHHVDLALTAREVRRVLKPGGRAIFREPMRDSRVLTALRALVPYRPPDVSPFERPLRWSEIAAFASHFDGFRYRKFDLPPARVLFRFGGSTKLKAVVQNVDRDMLRRFRRLERYAAVIVFEVRKQG